MSHPEWVRGLKLELCLAVLMAMRSHPEWVRGLKHASLLPEVNLSQVAPRVGAWIETR